MAASISTKPPGPSKLKVRDPLAWDDGAEIPASIVKARQRIKDSLTGTGLRDFVFYASPLIQDTRENLSENFPALDHLCSTIARAARTLDDLNWERFIELPVTRQHCMDYEMHTAFFAKIEPTWKTLITMPKGVTTPCVFLHLGTQPISAPLGDLLDKMGWFGVSIGAMTPPKHLSEKIDHVQLDPLKDEDDANFEELTAKKGGMCPKPRVFKLAFIKLLFSPDDAVLDSDDEEDESKEGGMDTIAEEPQEAHAVGDPSDPAEPSTPEKKKGLHELMGTESLGYGKLGVTRGMHVRRRLRGLRNVLNVALSRLENEGTLCITWPALPFHPMLFFLTHYLRGLFMRVHVITPDTIKSWEIYILCAGFKREDKDKPGAGGGSELKSFLDGAYRANCLDDVLLWTLTAEVEKTEAEGQKGTLAVGYEELWTVFANKFEALALELKTEVVEPDPLLQQPADPASQQPGKAAGGKPKQSAADRRRAERDGKRRGGSKTDPASSRSGSKQDKLPGRQVAGGVEPHDQIDLEESDSKIAAELGRDKKEEDRKKNMEMKAADANMSKEEYETDVLEKLKAFNDQHWRTMGNDGVRRFIPHGTSRYAPRGKEKEKKRGPFRPIEISRSYPTLACSLGASAGSSYKGFPDRKAFVEQFPLLAHALDCTEQKERRWHRRRELLGLTTRVIPGGENGSLQLSEDLRCIPEASATMPPSPPSKLDLPSPAAHSRSMPSLPRFKRMVPPPLPQWSEARRGPARPG